MAVVVYIKHEGPNHRQIEVTLATEKTLTKQRLGDGGFTRLQIVEGTSIGIREVPDDPAEASLQPVTQADLKPTTTTTNTTKDETK